MLLQQHLDRGDRRDAICGRERWRESIMRSDWGGGSHCRGPLCLSGVMCKTILSYYSHGGTYGLGSMISAGHYLTPLQALEFSSDAVLSRICCVTEFLRG